MSSIIKQNSLAGKAFNRRSIFWVGSGLILLFSYLSHLGTLPLDVTTDEPRRALVSLEMMLSGNYLVPTLNGDIYLNKPPIYNWLIIAFVKAFGNYSMFAFRLPVIVSLLIFSCCIFYYTKKFTSEIVAAFTAFAFATNGRILIYDSLQGLIDTTFALIVYLNFMMIFTLGEKRKYLQLFIGSYLLTAVGFLTKGFPMVIFEAISLLIYFGINKQVKLLFTLKHLWGILIFMLLVGSYLFSYFQASSISPILFVNNLLHESSNRTLLENSLKFFFKHLFLFPVEFLYHFAPWTIFIVAIYNKGLLNQVRSNRFIFYSTCLFLGNILIYWLSPAIYPRYLFMFLPLLFSVLFFLYFFKGENSWQHAFIRIVVVTFCGASALACIIFPFTESSIAIDNVLLKAAIIGLVFCCLCIVAIKFKTEVLHVFVFALVVARIGFNLFVIDQRGVSNRQVEAIGINIATITEGKNLYLHRGVSTGNFDGMSFHISKKRKEILTFNDSIVAGAFYITDSASVKGRNYEEHLKFQFHESDKLMVVRYK